MRALMTALMALLPLMHAPALRAAEFTSPTVDLENRQAGDPASLAVWTTARVHQAGNTEVNIEFPNGFALNGVNPSSCECLFVKVTRADGTFSPNEVTVTAGHVASQRLEVHLPVEAYPGPMYIRVDASSPIVNPSTAGSGTLALLDGQGDPVVSHSFRILAGASTPEPTQGAISGKVLDSAGNGVAGAIVVATTSDSFALADAQLGPAVISAEPMEMDKQVLMAVSGQDGAYSLNAPVGSSGSTYYVQANYTIRTDQALQTFNTPLAPVDVAAAATVTQDLSQASLVSSASLN